MSQTARAKILYPSSSEDDESDGELAANPEWSATAAAAGGSSHASASAAPAWSPQRFTPFSPPQPGPPGVVAQSTTHIEPGVPPPIASLTPLRGTPRQPPPSHQAPPLGRLQRMLCPPPPLPQDNITPPPPPLHAPPSPTRSDRSTTSNKRPRSELQNTPASRAADTIAEEAAASSNTPIHHPEAQDDLDVKAMEEEEL
jgi:hypothetical protein